MLEAKSWLSRDAAGGIILVVAALLAMGLANHSATSADYFALLDYPLTPQLPGTSHPATLSFWINDGLMALFFLFVGLEVKQEFVSGALATRRTASFPILAALGGMLAPALIFVLFNHHQPESLAGWAIPTATDIAFALGILSLLGPRVPKQLIIFLMTLAVVDDLGAILIIALFYTQHLVWQALLLALLCVATLWTLNRSGQRNVMLYLVIGVGLWFALLASGVHATLAGIIVGLMIPVAGQKQNSARQLAHRLDPWLRWAILPLFALANAGIALTGINGTDLLDPLPLGVIGGLVVGKPLGITAICALGVRIGWVSYPTGVRLADIAAIGLLCGIGFTMSIFITGLAFDPQQQSLISESKLAILSGSSLSALCGYWMLAKRFPGVKPKL